MGFMDFLEKSFDSIKKFAGDIEEKTSKFESYSEEELLKKLNNSFTGFADKIAIMKCLKDNYNYTTERLEKYKK